MITTKGSTEFPSGSAGLKIPPPDAFIDPKTRSGRLAKLCARHEATYTRTTRGEGADRVVTLTMCMLTGERTVGSGPTTEAALDALEKRMETFR